MKSDGFTLIELLVVVSVVGILATISLNIINYQKHTGEARNIRRQVDLHAISLTIMQYTIDTGQLPAQIPNTSTYICKRDALNCAGLVDLNSIFATPKYLSTFPVDPYETNENSTGYQIYKTFDNKIVVHAPHAENGKIIQVVR